MLHDTSHQEPLNESGDYRDTWRIFRIMAEFVEGYQFLNSFERIVTVLGSARLTDDHVLYQEAKKLGALLAKKQYVTMTGGGPGIMEAANHGAYEAGGESLGLNIQLPFEQRINPYVKKSTAFYYFFTRKVMLTSPAHGFVFFPGGFGTLDEFFEVVNHIELGKMCEVPIVLVGKEYWQPLLNFVEDGCCALDPHKHTQMKTWRMVESAEEAFACIEEVESGPQFCDLSAMNIHTGQKMDWRIFRIMAELVEGFEFLTGLVEDVTVLGTRHVRQGDQEYETAYTIGKQLAEQGYTIVTGGGTGISEAANKGAFEAGGESYGIHMETQRKNPSNHYLTKSMAFTFPFTRKLIVTAPSKAFVFFPGGFGTLHHLFEVLTLIQTGKMQQIPVLLFGKKFWEPLRSFVEETLAKTFKTIALEDAEIFTIVESESEVVKRVNAFRGNHKEFHWFGKEKEKAKDL